MNTTRTLKLTIAYDGTRYAGWQRQHGLREPTIQATLERILRRVLQEPVRVVGSGRTDSGVHALAQVAHVRVQNPMPLPRLHRALNSLLPSDIAVAQVTRARATFHARFAVQRKRYRYRLATTWAVSPFERPYVHHLPRVLNTARMRRAARALIGTHDMAPFQAAGSRVRHTVRRITDASVTQRRGEIWIEVEATGFLYKMVRRIVGTLIHVGLGHKPPRVIHEILSSRRTRLVGPTAPARGLTLLSVTY